MHQVMCTKCKSNIMLDFQIFRISQVLNMEEILNLMNTLLCQIDDLILLIYNEVTAGVTLPATIAVRGLKYSRQVSTQ